MRCGSIHNLSAVAWSQLDRSTKKHYVSCYWCPTWSINFQNYQCSVVLWHVIYDKNSGNKFETNEGYKLKEINIFQWAKPASTTIEYMHFKLFYHPNCCLNWITRPYLPQNLSMRNSWRYCCPSALVSCSLRLVINDIPCSGELKIKQCQHKWFARIIRLWFARVICANYVHIKGVVNSQNTLDNVVPRKQQWPLDITQWHITPHPQLSSNIIILHAFHTHRRIKRKFSSHINSIYLSDIYEEIIHHFYHVGFVLTWGSGNSWPTAYCQ